VTPVSALETQKSALESPSDASDNEETTEKETIGPPIDAPAVDVPKKKESIMRGIPCNAKGNDDSMMLSETATTTIINTTGSSTQIHGGRWDDCIPFRTFRRDSVWRLP